MESDKIRANIRHLFSILFPIIISISAVIFLVKPVSAGLVLINAVLVVIIVVLLLIYVFCERIWTKK